MRAYCSIATGWPCRPGHRFPVSKYRLLRERLEGHPGLALIEAPAATDGELALAHTPSM